MAAVVKIPTQLRAAAGGESEAEVEGATVQEVLALLALARGAQEQPAEQAERQQ